MARHTYPAQRADDLAFPIRIKVIVPGSGFGGMLDRMHEWLKVNAPGRSAQHPAQSSAALHAIAFYFRAIEDAAAFLAAFPDLVLADSSAVREAGPTRHHGEGYGPNM